LVLTEITLPLLNGHALCEILRRDRATADIPILVVTAEVRPDHLAQARRAGADSVLIKPVPPEDVLNEIQRLLATESRRNGAAPGAETTALAEQSATSLDAPERRGRHSQMQAFHRNTTTLPPAPPPVLLCPSCDGQLRYEHSHIGGVNEREFEQWDHYVCTPCGTFQYRHRTRKLSRVS
jgi:DNA-binding NtrC family response regulator